MLMAMRIKPKLLRLVYEALCDLTQLTPQFCIMPLVSLLTMHQQSWSSGVFRSVKFFPNTGPLHMPSPLQLHPLCLTFSFPFFGPQCKYHLFGEVFPEYLFLHSFCLPGHVLCLSILLVTNCNLGLLGCGFTC